MARRKHPPTRARVRRLIRHSRQAARSTGALVRARARALAGAALLLGASGAQAVVIERMQVERDDTRYTVAAAMLIDVPRQTAFRAATDYERLPEFNPSIVSSKRLSGRRLRSNIRLCVSFFCKQIEQVMRYVEQAPERIDMQVLPNAGDLKRGHADWRFSAAERGGTRLLFDAEIEPAFWVPPLIGPYLIARELRRQARVTAESIERLADDYGNDNSRSD